MPIRFQSDSGHVAGQPRTYHALGTWEAWREQFPHLPANWRDAWHPDIIGGMQGRSVIITTKEGKERRQKIRVLMHPNIYDKRTGPESIAHFIDYKDPPASGECVGCDKASDILIWRYVYDTEQAQTRWGGLLCAVCAAKFDLGREYKALRLSSDEIAQYWRDRWKDGK
jgi:hypothetical protein